MIPDISCAILFYFFFKVPLCPEFGDAFKKLSRTYPLALIEFLMYYLPAVRGYLVVLTSFNRMTAIIWPHKYSTWWNRYLNCGLIAAFFAGLCSTWQLIFSKTSIVHFNDPRIPSYAITAIFKINGVEISNALSNVIQCSVVAVLGLVFNGVSLFYVSKKTPVLTSRKQKVEIAFLLVSIFDFVVELVYIIHQGIMFKLVSERRFLDPLFDVLYLQIPWIYDLNSFARPFLLVIICRQDLTFYVNFTISYKAPLTPLIGPMFADLPSSFFLQFMYFYNYFAPYVRSGLVMLTAANRLTALLYPSKHERIWRPWVFWSLVTIVVIVALLLSWFYIISEIIVIPFSPKQTGNYALIYGFDLFPVNSALNMVIYSTIVGGTSLIINLTSLFILMKQNSARAVTQKDTKQYFRKSEIGLCIVSLGDFSFELLMVIFQEIMNVLMLEAKYNDPLFDTIYLQMPWMTDLAILSRPFLLLFMSKQVRIVFGKAVFCGHHGSFMEVTTTTASKMPTKTAGTRIVISNGLVTIR
ncbi:hypothetical protein FO519_001798 [Halicephalobus sp. NKZ332]|nr:hypothetical protein FO519_001798 [Halicephalobus sp. NKZ332]